MITWSRTQSRGGAAPKPIRQREKVQIYESCLIIVSLVRSVPITHGRVRGSVAPGRCESAYTYCVYSLPRELLVGVAPSPACEHSPLQQCARAYPRFCALYRGSRSQIVPNK